MLRGEAVQPSEGLRHALALQQSVDRLAQRGAQLCQVSLERKASPDGPKYLSIHDITSRMGTLRAHAPKVSALHNNILQQERPALVI